MDYHSIYEPRALTWWDIEPYLPYDFQHLITVRNRDVPAEKTDLFNAVRKLKGISS